MSELDTFADVELAKLLEQLKLSIGWKVLCDIVDRNDLNAIKSKLLTGEYATIEDRNRDKDKYEIFMAFKEMPQKYIDILQPKEPIEVDPYYKTREEIDKG